MTEKQNTSTTAQLGASQCSPDSEIVRLINVLRADEGDSVTILCDNPDFNGQPNCAVVCNGDWTGWVDRRFAADTVLDALSMAMAEKKLPAPRKVIAESNGHHWVERFHLVCCRDCGFVRRSDDQNKPCKGVVTVALRSPDEAAKAPEPVAWRAFCEKTGGQMVNPVATKDLLIEQANLIYAEHGYVLQPLYLGAARSSAGMARPISEEELHAIEHARYRVEQASPDNPDCCFDYELVKNLLDVIDRDALRFTDVAQGKIDPGLVEELADVAESVLIPEARRAGMVSAFNEVADYLQEQKLYAYAEHIRARGVSLSSTEGK